MEVKGKPHRADFVRFVCRRSNLKKYEEGVSRMQAQLEDNKKMMGELAEQLKKLENEAGEIMTAFKEAEVGPVQSKKNCNSSDFLDSLMCKISPSLESVLYLTFSLLLLFQSYLLLLNFCSLERRQKAISSQQASRGHENPGKVEEFCNITESFGEVVKFDRASYELEQCLCSPPNEGHPAPDSKRIN